MHIMFIDESGTPPKPTKTNVKYFVVGGVIISENAWHRIRDALMGLKARYHIRGEIKWRYFAPTNDDEKNPMRKLGPPDRDKIREELYKLPPRCPTWAVTTSPCLASLGYLPRGVSLFG
jgi:hypothetical protein